ncbi:MAG TPA: translation initiation factor IF-3 [Thiotrichaceae bacterium]|nr:translation initiation factor IF-3 [Thiotrichaceae bacterium]
MAGKKKKQLINENIISPEVRLIDGEGENRGVVSLTEAKQIAADAKLDLVEIVPNAKPSVCRVMDYGKFKFEESKKRSQAKKKTKRTQVKEIKLRPGTDIGDYNIKLRKLKEFLEAGDKTKVTVRFRGREMAHRELGMDMLMRIEKDLEDMASVEQRPKFEGRQMMMVLSPSTDKK